MFCKNVFFWFVSVGGMSRPPKPTATAKKVAPPAVPYEFRHSGSSFGSAGYGSSEDGSGGFLAPADPPGVPRGKLVFYFKNSHKFYS